MGQCQALCHADCRHPLPDSEHVQPAEVLTGPMHAKSGRDVALDIAHPSPPEVAIEATYFQANACVHGAHAAPDIDTDRIWNNRFHRWKDTADRYTKADMAIRHDRDCFRSFRMSRRLPNLVHSARFNFGLRKPRPDFRGAFAHIDNVHCLRFL